MYLPVNARFFSPGSQTEDCSPGTLLAEKKNTPFTSSACTRGGHKRLFFCSSGLCTEYHVDGDAGPAQSQTRVQTAEDKRKQGRESINAGKSGFRTGKQRNQG